jgi:hypothetical protein
MWVMLKKLSLMKSDPHITHGTQIVVDGATEIQRGCWVHKGSTTDRAAAIAADMVLLLDVVALGCQLDLEVLDDFRSFLTLVTTSFNV